MNTTLEDRLVLLENMVKAIVSSFSIDITKPRFFSIPALPNIEIVWNCDKSGKWEDTCKLELRLPTQQELMILWASLTNEEKEKYGFKNEKYWTSAFIYDNAFWVDFEKGIVNCSSKNNETMRLRYVRDIIK